jgi:uncharacterized protein (TIGR02302 family)
MVKRNGPFYKAYLGLARASLLWEYLWPALWPAVATAGIFIGAALLDLFSLLPVWLHIAVVIGFLIVFAGALQRAFTRIPKVDFVEARHRIEEDSGFDHRPLTALDDELALGGNDAQARTLWEAHRARMAAEAERLSLKVPRAGLARRDSFGFRAAVAAFLIVGVVAAGTDTATRLGKALLPPMGKTGLAASAKLSIWVTPPAYTGVPPVVITMTGNNAPQTGEQPVTSISVPDGSTVLAQMSGGGSVPALLIGQDRSDFNRIDADSYHVETELKAESGAKLVAIEQKGRTVASWPLTIIPDQPPTVEFSNAPEGSQQLRLQLSYEAKDDYRLTGLTASIRRLDGLAVPGGESEITLRLPLPGSDKKDVKGKSNHDLVSHVWAGLPVLVHILGTDEKGQTGLSKVEPVILPERQFSHPAAKEIYEIRKGLTAEARDRRLGVLKLDLLTSEPEMFDGHTGTYLALRIARERLDRDGQPQSVAQVQKMLWDAALRLEEGRTATAGSELADAQRRLMEALDRGASQEELERLMAEVEKALQEFMSALMKELQQRGQLPPMDPNAQTMTNQDIQKMLDRARELLRQGSREAARQLMAELQRMLQNLRGAMARQNNGQMSQQQQQAQKAMRELRGIVQRQQKLLDETHKRAQRQREEGIPDGPENDPQSREGLEEQEAIRKQLGELMGKLGQMMGQIPKGLGDAEQAMRESEGALKQGRQGKSIDPQGRALEALRKGAQNSARAMAQMMGRGQRGQMGRQGGRFSAFTGPRLRGMRPGNRDPFGRRNQEEEGSTGQSTGTVKIPSESEIRRARRILEELRRRAGDLWRPELELEYIERLLKRF